MSHSTSVKFVFIAVAALTLCGGTPPGRTCSFAPALTARSLDKICAEEISEDIRVLASDEFEGRQPGTPGEDKTVDYLVKELSRAGLAPAGDRGGWFQFVPMTMGRVIEGAQIEVVTPRGSRRLVRGEDLTLLARGEAGQVTYEKAPIVFAGYGLSRPGLGWDDLAGIDVRGKILLVLNNAPPNAPADNDFDGFASVRTRSIELGRLGAAGVLFISPETSEDWPVLSRQGQQPQIQVAWNDLPAPPLLGMIKRSAVEALLRDAGMPLAELERQAGTSGFRAKVIPGLGLSARFTTTQDHFTSRTVAAQLRGKTAPDEVVIYSAHWDHLGRGGQLEYPGRLVTEAPSADDIYNGAIDNAGGTAALLSIARWFGRAKASDRTVLFLFWTSEESGLFGSEYYIKHPLVPFACSVAVLNMDTVPFGVPSQEVTLAGQGKTNLETDINRIAAAHRLEVRPTRTSNIYRRSDHLNFARAGVPVLYIAAGSKPLPEFASAPEAGEEFDRYMQERYHHVTDEWRAELDFRPAAQLSQLLLELGSELAQSRRWPEWNAGIPVRAMREASRRQARCGAGN